MYSSTCLCLSWPFNFWHSCVTMSYLVFFSRTDFDFYRFCAAIGVTSASSPYTVSLALFPNNKYSPSYVCTMYTGTVSSVNVLLKSHVGIRQIPTGMDNGCSPKRRGERCFLVQRWLICPHRNRTDSVTTFYGTYTLSLINNVISLTTLVTNWLMRYVCT